MQGDRTFCTASSDVSAAPDPERNQVLPMQIKTPRLSAVLQSRAEVERMLDAMSAYDRSQVSADWLARLRTAEEGDPWAFAFRLLLAETETAVGTCSFKGPPVDGVVEIAYGVFPEFEGRGYATEAAQALVALAAASREVSLIRAHTLPDAAASKRVLEKCGFVYVGDHSDPDDGVVARFEITVGSSARS